MKRNRIKELERVIDIQGKMSFVELEQYFPDVSQMTLRRDLLVLEQEGKVIRVRGGAMSVKEVQKVSGEPYAKKSVNHLDEKQEIAKKTAGLIDEGVCFFIDGGTTSMSLAKELKDMPCTIFTNGMAVAIQLAQKKHPNVTVIGGQLLKDNLSTASTNSKAVFENSNFELAILSASAFTVENGFSCGSQFEAELLEVILKKAKHIYMMLDSSKIGKIMPFTFAHLEDIDVLITDEAFPSELKKIIEEKNKVVM